MKKNNIIFGILLILTALFIVFDSLGYFNTSIGPVKIIFTAILLIITIKGILKINFPMILFPIALICIIFSKELSLSSLTPWPILFIALLLSVGLSLIFGKNTFKFNALSHNNMSETIEQLDESTIKSSVSFGSSIKYINSDDFKSAYIEASFGSAKVYFDNAIIKDSTATITLEASFSSVELYVPKNWTIIQQVNNSFSGVDEKNNRGIKEDGPTVYLTGEISFSGVTIYYC